MGAELRRWLAPRLPRDVSPGERIVALEIADQAWDHTRVFSRENAMRIVAVCTGYKLETVGTNLAKLGKRGIELRVPIGKKTDGTPLYAARGREVEFRVPTAEECPALLSDDQVRSLVADMAGGGLLGDGMYPDKLSRLTDYMITMHEWSDARGGNVGHESPDARRSNPESPDEHRSNQGGAQANAPTLVGECPDARRGPTPYPSKEGEGDPPTPHAAEEHQRAAEPADGNRSSHHRWTADQLAEAATFLQQLQGPWKRTARQAATLASLLLDCATDASRSLDASLAAELCRDKGKPDDYGRTLKWRIENTTHADAMAAAATEQPSNGFGRPRHQTHTPADSSAHLKGFTRPPRPAA